MGEPLHVTAARHFAEAYGAQIVPLWGILDGPAGSICRCREGASCTNAGKHPVQAFKGKASRLPSAFHNWGYVSDTIVVIDFDNPDVDAPWALPDTFRVMTRKGYHLLYRWDGAPLRTRIGIVPGIDIKASGGLVVGPYSRRVDGGIYEPANSLDMAPLPLAVVAAIGKRSESSAPSGTMADRTSHFAQAALDNLCAEIAALPMGSRNNTLYVLLCRTFRAGWLGKDALPAIITCAVHSGLAQYEVERTVDSAYRSVFAA